MKIILYGADCTGNPKNCLYPHRLEITGPAIMKWIIEGAQKSIRQEYRFETPRCVEEAIGAYRRNNDWMSSFLEDCCEVGKELQEKSGELYLEYRAFCARTGEYTRSTTDFYSALEANGFERRNTNRGRIICGLRLKGDFLSDA